MCRAYANAVQDDLWTALQNQAVQENVRLPATMKEIMVILKVIIFAYKKEEITRFLCKGHLDFANGLSSDHSST